MQCHVHQVQKQMSNPTSNPIGRLANRLQDYRECAALARRQTGKNQLLQLREILALNSTGGQCGISDYYDCGLYDDSYLKGRGRQDFLGWRLHTKFSLALNPRYAVLPACDKTVFTQMADSAGLPVAPIRACFHRAAHVSPSLGMHLRSIEEVKHFLRDPSIYPLFGKPAYSQQGYGSAYLASYDPATDAMHTLNGESISIDNFVKRMDHSVDERFHKPECGFLFQDSLKPASEILAFTNWPAICGVRVVCLNGPEGIQPIQALWKIATPPNHVDNFHSGENGNFLADVDLATGEVCRMVGRGWPRVSPFQAHPDTGHAINGFRLPGWSQVLDTCRRAGPVFPLMKIHHWDFALTDQGPKILELNDIGGIAQLHGRGLLTVETREFLKRHANVQTHPWVKLL